MGDFDRIAFGIVNAGDVPEIAERFLIFTVPVLLLFANGQEVLREARIVHLDLFRERIIRFVEALSDDEG